MQDRTLVRTGVVGAPYRGDLLATPLLVITLGALGLAGAAVWLDWLVIPSLIGFVFVACVGLYWLRRAARSPLTTRRSQMMNSKSYAALPLKPGLTPVLESTITCPQCGAEKLETMPTDACQFFYDCPGCAAVLKPKPSDCCVFCSYGDVPCPPIQEGGGEGCCS